MARIRSVHPDICVDEVLANVSARVERTFVRLWTHLDDDGRCIDHPKLIKAALYPLHDDMTPDEVDADLWELVEHGLLLRYRVDGKRVIAAKPAAWSDRQKPKHPSPSKLPGPPEDYTPPTRPRGDISPTSPPNGVSPTPDLPPVFPGSGEDYPESLHGVVDGVGEGDGGGVGVRAAEPPGKLSLVPAPVSSPPATVLGSKWDQANPPAAGRSKRVPATGGKAGYSDHFEAWWSLYPRKVAKFDAWKSWQRACTLTDLDSLHQGLEASVRAWRSQGRGLAVIPHAATWLNQRRWEDPPEADMPQPSRPKGFDGIEAALRARGSA